MAAEPRREQVPKRARPRGWRKIAAATWGRPRDPQIYGDLEVDVTPMLEFIDRTREATGVRLTLTHLVGKGVAHALGENPDLNVRLHRGKHVRRDTVDMFFIVSAESGSELTGIKVERCDERPVVEIARELSARAARVHDGDDEEMGRTKAMLAGTPTLLLRPMLRLASWLAIDLDLDLRRFGAPRQTFGSAMISSVGMFGIQHAYAPLSPYYRVPFLVLVGEAAERPVVRDGQIVARPIVGLSTTMDHRLIDGFHAARLSRSATEYFDNPGKFEPPPEELALSP